MLLELLLTKFLELLLTKFLCMYINFQVDAVFKIALFLLLKLRVWMKKY